MAHVKIITINTWKCDGKYRQRMQILAKQLITLKPDVIACQECFVSVEAKIDTLRFLAEQLGMNYLFAPGRLKERFFEGNWVSSFSGLGILSAYPLSSIANFDLPACSKDNDRQAQQVEVGVAGPHKLIMTNVHLTHLEDQKLRQKQAEFLADNTKQLSAFHHKIVCGDFNAARRSTEVVSFVDRCNAIDCYTAGNGPEPRYSLIESGTGDKQLCIDHIFAVPSAEISAYPKFINSAAVLNEQDGDTGLYPSDHFGISTTLVTE